ncbi:MAG: ATP-binding protein [Clostridia bacterium]|nr:ATP-binding protein [Clostridia bacterium]
MFVRSYAALSKAMETEHVAAETHKALTGTVVFSVLTVLLVALAAVMLARFYMQRDKRRGREAMAVEAKSDFFSKMSHDMRTPLNAVIGLQALALDTDDMQTVKSYLRESQTASNYLLSIINDVLDMSRIESGKLTLSSMPFDLEELLAQIKPIVASMAAERNLCFAVDTDEPFETAYIGDAVRIKQVLMNLLNNAVKFTKEGKVALCIQHAAKAGGQDGITIKVSDTGVGMSADFLQRIFKPFEQERSDYTQQFVGSGLGLAIVHNLVTLMGGTIDVVSEPRRGTTFTIQLTLPRGEALSRKEAPAAQEIPSFAGRRALIVEDNSVNRRIIAQLLKRKFSIDADTASDGRQGVEVFTACAQGYYDFILMDVKMPVMDGLEAAQRIRSLPRADAKTVPIIALSANAFASDIALSIQAGMDEHLTKPIEITALLSVLTKYLS